MGKDVDGDVMQGNVYRFQYETATASIFNPKTQRWQECEWPLKFKWGVRDSKSKGAAVRTDTGEWSTVDKAWIWPSSEHGRWLALDDRKRIAGEHSGAELVLLSEDAEHTLQTLAADVDGVLASPNGDLALVRMTGHWGELHVIVDTQTGVKLDDFSYNISGGAQRLRCLALSVDEVVSSLKLAQALKDSVRDRPVPRKIEP